MSEHFDVDQVQGSLRTLPGHYEVVVDHMNEKWYYYRDSLDTFNTTSFNTTSVSYPKMNEWEYFETARQRRRRHEQEEQIREFTEKYPNPFEEKIAEPAVLAASQKLDNALEATLLRGREAIESVV